VGFIESNKVRTIIFYLFIS